MEFEDVSDHDLSLAQTRSFASLDPLLHELGYRPMINKRPTNMQGRALIRTYFSDADPAIVMMNLMTSEVEGSAEQPMNYLEITTRYGDGTILSIRCRQLRRGTTSVCYGVTVGDVHRPEIPAIFATSITLVNVDDQGAKQPLPR